MDLFISDLHLNPHHPKRTEAFFRFLSEYAASAQRLYILGDFFDFWIGDDAGNAFSEQVQEALRQCSQQGTDIALMGGNRDFLIGEQFCTTANIRLLPEQQVIETGGKRAVILHGDELCTDDLKYMQLRLQLRNKDWLEMFLGQTVAERLQFAQHLRMQSQKENQEKTEEIMDVNPAAVQACFQKHGVDIMIHGHTHRPFNHKHEYGNRVHQRWVLGDWDRKLWFLKVEGDHWDLIEQDII